jgi:hypothetical protein
MAIKRIVRRPSHVCSSNSFSAALSGGYVDVIAVAARASATTEECDGNEYAGLPVMPHIASAESITPTVSGDNLG